MDKKKVNNNQKNPWKWAFTILVAFIIALGVFIVFEIFTPDKSAQQKTQSVKAPNAQTTALNVDMSKQQLSSVINSYLNHHENSSNNINYKFILDRSALLVGTTQIFGKKVSFTLYADPYVNKDGDISLKVKSVAIGSLNAPKEFTLTYVKNHFHTGKGVQIEPKKSKITIKLDQFQTQQGISVQATQFDLKQNNIKFKILIPLDKEGN